MPEKKKTAAKKTPAKKATPKVKSPQQIAVDELAKVSKRVAKANTVGGFTLIAQHGNRVVDGREIGNQMVPNGWQTATIHWYEASEDKTQEPAGS